MKDTKAGDEGPDLDAIEITDLQIDTLSGDIRDALLMRVRTMKRPWSMMTEAEQTDVANGLDLTARDLIARAVRLLSSWEFPRAVVRLQDVKIVGGEKAGITAKVECANISEYRDVLGEHAGQMMVLVAVDSDNFKGERAPAKIDPDQPSLPTGEEETGDDCGIPENFDELVKKAETYIRAEERASTSFVQRKLAIGYNAAARIVEELEKRGVLSAPDNVGARSILPPKRGRKPKDEPPAEDTSNDEGGDS